MSGSAGISVLEEGVFYSYEEHGRKILEADEYQDYFARKRKAMLGAIVYAIPEFRAWKKAVAAAGLKIEDAPIFRTEENDPRLSVIVLEGSRGTTRLTVEWQKRPNATEVKKLKDLSSRLEFSKLDKMWEKAGYPEASAKHLKGVMVARAFPKFALGLAMTADIHQRLEPAIRRALEHRMETLSAGIEKGFEEQVARGSMWIDPATLLPYEKVLGPLPKGAELNDPQNSKFNFFGPLFDSVGGRTATSIGHVKASMLFLSSNKDWDKDRRFGAKRGEFETWYRWAVRDPDEIQADMQVLLQNFLASRDKVDDPDYAAVEAKDKLEWVLKQRALYPLVTKPALTKLRAIVMDTKVDARLKKHVLELLASSPSPERFETVREWVENRLYLRGPEGMIPTVLQAAQSIASEALTIEVPQSEPPRGKLLREQAQQQSMQMLKLLLAAQSRANLLDEERSWLGMSIQTFQNGLQSAIDAEKSGAPLDQGFLKICLEVMQNRATGP